MTRSVIERLQAWYAAQCNGDWEHTYRVSITNLDNPGWTVVVELQDTELYEIEFSPINEQRESEDDWVQCSKVGAEFRGNCGPQNLDELLTLFLDWAEKDEEGRVKITISGWNRSLPGFDKVGLNQVIRAHLGLPLAQAKHLVDEILDGREVMLLVQRERAVAFREDVAKVGAVVGRN